MTAAVDVPDDVRADVDPRLFAPWWRRAVALALDASVVGAVTFLVVGPGGWPWEWSVVLGGTNPVPGVGVLVSVGVTWLVLLALQAWTGATPGKRVVGVVVVGRADGRPLGPVRTLVRTAAHALDLLLLVGFVRPLWDPERRTFADSLCGTDVRVGRTVARHDGPHGRRRGDAAGARRARVARRGAVATTAGATALCVAAVALAAVQSTVVTPASDRTCGLADRAMGEDPPIASVELRVPEVARQTRLGVTRQVGGPADASVTWVVADQQEAPDGTRLSVRFGTSSGEVVAELGGTVRGGTLVPDDGPVLGGLALPVPRHVLGAAGSGGSWEAGVGTASVRAALCGGTLDPS